MSKTFSKIMVICALAVIVPLMVIGTAFAAYYSVNALVSVGIYTNAEENPQGAYAKVVYDNKENDTKFDVNQSHLKKLALKAEAKGYNFLGWYDGTAKTYKAEYTVDPTKIEYISKEEKLDAKMTDYDDVLAVFELKTFTVSYSYKADPEDGAISTEVPAGFGTTLVYGQALPTFTKAHYTFKGWKVNGSTELYTKANFDVTGDVALTVDDDCWQQAEQYTVKFVYGDTELGSITKYSDETVEFPEITLDAAGKLTTFDALADADRPVVEAGYKAIWKVNGSEASQATTETTVNLTKVAVVYSVSINGIPDVADYSKEKLQNVNFTVENKDTALTDIFAAANWKTEYSFWKFEGIKLDGADIASASDLADAIIGSSEHAAKSVAVTPNIHKYFTTISAVNVLYRTNSTSKPATFDQTVYVKDVGDSYFKATSAVELQSVDTTTSFATWLMATIQGVRRDSAEGADVSLYKVKNDDPAKNYFNQEFVSDFATINDFIEYMYADPANTIADADTFNCPVLQVWFK